MKRTLTLGCLLAATVPTLFTARLPAQEDAQASPYGLMTSRPQANPYPFVAGAPTEAPNWLTQTASVPDQAPAAQPGATAAPMVMTPGQQVGLPGPQEGAGIYRWGGTCASGRCVRPQDIFHAGQIEFQ